MIECKVGDIVRCVTPVSQWLTRGRSYEVLEVHGELIKVAHDNGKSAWVRSWRFEKTEQPIKPRSFLLTMTARLNVTHGEEVTRWPHLLNSLYPLTEGISSASLRGVQFTGWDDDVRVEPADEAERPLEVGDKATTPFSTFPAEVAFVLPLDNGEIRYVLKRGGRYGEGLWSAADLTRVEEHGALSLLEESIKKKAAGLPPGPL